MTVIDITAKPKRSIIPKRNHNTACACKCVYVVSQTRTIECQECGRVIDPYDFLWRWAQTGKRYADELESLKGMITSAKKELAGLRSEIARAKQEKAVRGSRVAEWREKSE